MSVVLDPMGALQAEIEEVTQRDDLTPEVRLQKLRGWAEDLTDLLGRISKYTGDLQLVQEAVGPAYHDAVMKVREDAEIRRVLVARGMLSEAELDEQGVLSHEDIDRLAEERLLDLWIAESLEVEEGLLDAVFDEMKHPRGAHGKFADVLGRPMKPKGRHGRAVLLRVPRAPAAVDTRTAAEKAAAAAKDVEGQRAPKAPAPHVPGSVDPEASATADQVASDLEAARSDGVLSGSKQPTRSKTAEGLLGDAADTQQLHSVSVRGRGVARVYSDERAKLHDQIIDTLLRERLPVHAVDAKGEPRFEDGHPVIEMVPSPAGKKLAPADVPRAMFLAGGTASGKSTALKVPEIAAAIPDGAVHIDADEIKTMLPEFNQLVAAKDKSASSVVHEESSDLAARLLSESQARGLNVVLDGTGNSPESTKFAGKITKLAGAGYETHALYVNAPTDVAISRAVSRGQKTGRYVDEPTVRQTHANVSRNFDAVRQLAEAGTLKSLRLVDTGSGSANLVLEGGGKPGPITVHDGPTYRRFLAKADEH